MKDIVTHVYHGDSEVSITEVEINTPCICGCMERATMFYGKPPVPVLNLRHYFNYVRKASQRLTRERIAERMREKLNLGSLAHG